MSNSILQCPAGVVGLSPGLKSAKCSAPCPVGKYSAMIGSTSLKVNHIAYSNS